MGTFYRSRHELILVFKHGTAPHLRTPSNWAVNMAARPHRTCGREYRESVNTRRAGTDGRPGVLHPTVKPVDN